MQPIEYFIDIRNEENAEKGWNTFLNNQDVPQYYVLTLEDPETMRTDEDRRGKRISSRLVVSNQYLWKILDYNTRIITLPETPSYPDKTFNINKSSIENCLAYTNKNHEDEQILKDSHFYRNEGTYHIEMTNEVCTIIYLLAEAARFDWVRYSIFKILNEGEQYDWRNLKELFQNYRKMRDAYKEKCITIDNTIKYIKDNEDKMGTIDNLKKELNKIGSRPKLKK
jgi:virulence-associated protein VapD